MLAIFAGLCIIAAHSNEFDYFEIAGLRADIPYVYPRNRCSGSSASMRSGACTR